MTFQQKYTPQSFGDLIFPDSNTRQRLLEFANNKRHGSLIFHGPYGTAKTTTAKILTEMRSEGLTYGGIDFYRACDLTHKSFERISNTRSMQVFADVIMPVTIVDEIDQVPSDLQYKLRWELDIQSNKCQSQFKIGQFPGENSAIVSLLCVFLALILYQLCMFRLCGFGSVSADSFHHSSQGYGRDVSGDRG